MPLVLVLLGAAPGTPRPEAGACPTIEACLARLVEISASRKPTAGITNEDEAIGKALAKLGPDALPPLIALLGHRKSQVRESAAYAISFFREAAKPAIPALIQAMKKKVGWATWALGHTKDPAVIPLLEKELLRGDLGAVQALELFGEAGVSVLVGVLEARNASGRALEGLQSAFEGWGAPAVPPSVVPRLVAVLADARRPRLARRVAVLWLEHIGPAASLAIPELRKVREASGDKLLRGAASTALAAMGDGEVVATLVRHLDNPDSDARRWSLSHLGRLGPAAAPAVPRLSELLRVSQGWEERERAAEALGWTRSPEAVPALLEALGDPSWRVQYGAVTALGLVGEREAVPALNVVRREHWFSPVRRAAQRAVEAIALASQAPRPMHHSRGFQKARWEVWAGRELTPEEQCWDEAAQQWRVRKGERWLTLKPVDRPRQSPESPQDASIPEPPDPYTSFHRVQGGRLMGVNKGEFGGELWFLSEDGRRTRMLETKSEAVLGFAELPGRLLLFTGMAHLGLNEGFAQTLTREADGTWTLHFLAQLAGFPKAWRIDADLTVVVATDRSGVVELSANGTQRMLGCP